jgi:hypothetical protein
MSTIATNIYKELSEKDKKNISRVSGRLGKIEIYEYFEKGLGRTGRF